MTHLPRRAVLAALASLPFASAAYASPNRVATNRAGIAMQGYDTHAYWTINAAREGDADYVVEWRGTPWHFASAEDAEQFRADPAAYEPQFGGFCTRAMSFKKIVDGDPEVWRIHQGKLYLFARPVGGTYFDKGQDAMIAKAQAYWDTLS
jgi:YHS domain-containing protein